MAHTPSVPKCRSLDVLQCKLRHVTEFSHFPKLPLTPLAATRSLARLSSPRRSPLFSPSLSLTPRRHLPDSLSPVSPAYLPTTATFLRVHTRRPFTPRIQGQRFNFLRRRRASGRRRRWICVRRHSIWAREALDLRSSALDAERRPRGVSGAAPEQPADWSGLVVLTALSSETACGDCSFKGSDSKKRRRPSEAIGGGDQVQSSNVAADSTNESVQSKDKGEESSPATGTTTGGKSKGKGGKESSEKEDYIHVATASLKGNSPAQLPRQRQGRSSGGEGAAPVTLGGKEQHQRPWAEDLLELLEGRGSRTWAEVGAEDLGGGGRRSGGRGFNCSGGNKVIFPIFTWSE